MGSGTTTWQRRSMLVWSKTYSGQCEASSVTHCSRSCWGDRSPQCACTPMGGELSRRWLLDAWSGCAVSHSAWPAGTTPRACAPGLTGHESSLDNAHRWIFLGPTGCRRMLMRRKWKSSRPRSADQGRPSDPPAMRTAFAGRRPAPAAAKALAIDCYLKHQADAGPPIKVPWNRRQH